MAPRHCRYLGAYQISCWVSLNLLYKHLKDQLSKIIFLFVRRHSVIFQVSRFQVVVSLSHSKFFTETAPGLTVNSAASLLKEFNLNTTLSCFESNMHRIYIFQCKLGQFCWKERHYVYRKNIDFYIIYCTIHRYLVA